MIRLGKVEDIPELIQMGQELAKQSPFVRTVNPAKARKNLAFFMNSKRCAVFVAEHNERVVGFIVGGIEDNWYSDEQSVSDVAFYVEPTYRIYAAGLVKALRRWAKSFPRVADFMLGISSGVDGTERTGALYEKLGLFRTGGIYAQLLSGENNEQSNQ